MVTDPLSNEKNKNQQRIKIIDVSGQKKYRQQSWSQYYDQIHGLIYVVDASESERLSENQETLDELLKNEKLKDKPILM
jgi:GTPase SAR1 family protein